nr:MAG TPA: hypothetical protein [Caudoviricetes sp.]
MSRRTGHESIYCGTTRRTLDRLARGGADDMISAYRLVEEATGDNA